MAFETIITVCSDLISGFLSFFTRSSSTLGQNDNKIPSQLETTPPGSPNTAPQIPSVSNFDMEAQMNMDSDSSSAASSSSSSAAASSSFSSSSAVDEVKEAKQPWVHETMFGDSSPARGGPTRASLQMPINNQETSPHVNQNSTETLHPIVRIFQQQELGRHLLVLAIPMIIALSTFYRHVNAPIAVRVLAVVLSLGVAAIWDGILLRNTCPRASVCLEFLGVAFMLLAFYGFVVCFLPKTLVWIPILCWLLNLLPLAIVFYSGERVL